MALLMQSFSIDACTGFVVDGDATIYGMNFDFYTDDIKFFIEESGSMKVFYMAFGQGDNYIPTVGMNSDGVFASLQELYPESPSNSSVQDGQEYLYMLFYDALYEGTLDTAVSNAMEKEIVNGETSIHLLMGDHHGQSYVVEPGVGHVFNSDEDDYQVMTNFSHVDNEGKAMADVKGVGSDRYREACSVIEEAGDSFSYDDAFKALKNSTQSSGNYPTQSSLVFDPENTIIYLSIKSDFTHKWKIDMNEKTIETYSGYDGYRNYVLDHEGIHLSKLENPILKPIRDDNDDISPKLMIAAIGAVLAVTVIWILVSKKR